MAEITGTNNGDNTSNLDPQPTNGPDTIKGLGGNDDLQGLGGKDTIFGNSGADDINGGPQDDRIDGGTEGDQIYGGDGNDTMFGQDGPDLLFGQKGFNTYLGGEGNDILTGLGELNVDEDGNGLISTGGPVGYDSFQGEGGDDTFRLRAGNDAAGRFFVKGQKAARIFDFDPGTSSAEDGDKIVLPGSPDNYRGIIYGDNNEGTAILYTEDPDIDLGISFGGLSVGSDTLSVPIPDQTAVVAVLEGVTARDMTNPNFYEYTG